MTNNILTGFVNRENHIFNRYRATVAIGERRPNESSGLTQLIGTSGETVLPYQVIAVWWITGNHGFRVGEKGTFLGNPCFFSFEDLLNIPLK